MTENDADEALFECADGRRFFPIVMLKRIWYDHILDEHFDLAGREAQVELAITQPDEIRRDRNHQNRACYYKIGDLPPPLHDRFVKVVVEVEDTENGRRGFVITAFVVPGIDHRERKIW